MVCFRCLDRLLENWDPLKDFFSGEKDALKTAKSTASYAVGKVETIFQFLRSPTNQLYTMFLTYTVKVFESFLRTFQAEEPMIHLLRKGLQRLLRAILCKFVKPSAMLHKKLEDVDYKQPYNIKPNSELVIGEAARKFLKDKAANHLRDCRVGEFFKDVTAYFVALADYLKTHLPLAEPLLQHVEVVDVSTQVEASSQSLRYLVDRFPSLLPSGSDANTISEQFAVYQLTKSLTWLHA